MSHSIKSLRRSALLYTGIGLLLTAVSIVLRCVNFFYFYDAEIGYHQAGAALPVVANVLLIVSVILFAVAAFLLFRKKSIGYEQTPAVAARVAAWFPAVGYLFLLIMDFLNFTKGSSFPWMQVLFGIGGIAYFLMLALNVGKEGYRVLTGFCAILRLVLALSDSYFNILVQMNAPNKLMFQLGCLGGMLFLVSELRALIARTRPAFYMFSAACAALLLGVASIPSIIACHGNILADTDLPASYYMQLGLFLYVAVRLICVSLRPLSPAPFEEDITDYDSLYVPAEEEDAEESAPEEESAPTPDTNEESTDKDHNE